MSVQMSVQMSQEQISFLLESIKELRNVVTAQGEVIEKMQRNIASQEQEIESLKFNTESLEKEVNSQKDTIVGLSISEQVHDDRIDVLEENTIYAHHHFDDDTSDFTLQNPKTDFDLTMSMYLNEFEKKIVSNSDKKIKEDLKRLSTSVESVKEDLNNAYECMLGEEEGDLIREKTMMAIESGLCSISPLEEGWLSYYCPKNDCIMYNHTYGHYKETSDRKKACNLIMKV
jgi:hypothetical protein